MRLSTVLVSLLLAPFLQHSNCIGQVAGLVVTFRSEPVSKAFIEAVGWDRDTAGKIMRLFSEENGTFRIANLSPGKYRLYAWKESEGVPETRALIFEGSDPLYTEVTVDSQKISPRVVLKLPRPYGVVTGSIRDAQSERLVPKVRIRLERKEEPHIMSEESARADGTFKLLLPARPIRIIITAPGYIPWVYRGADGGDAVLVRSGDSIVLKVSMTPT